MAAPPLPCRRWQAGTSGLASLLAMTCFLLSSAGLAAAADTTPLLSLYTSPFNSFPMAGQIIQYRQGLATTPTPGIYAMTLQPSSNHTFALAIIHYFTTHNLDGQQNVPAFTYDQGYYYPVELVAGDLLAWSFTLVDYNSQQGDTVVLTIQTASAPVTPTPMPTPASTVAPTSTAAPTTVPATDAPTTSATKTTSTAPTAASTTAAAPPKTAAPISTAVPTTVAPTQPTVPATTPATTKASTANPVLSVSDSSASSSNVLYSVPSTVDSDIAAREARMVSRLTTNYAKLASMDSYAAMASLPWSGTSNMMFSMQQPQDATNATYRSGAPALLQIALFQPNMSQHLPAAINQTQLDVVIRINSFRQWVAAGNLPNGDVKQRQERGAIAYECWLLHQAGAYFVAPPGQAPNGTVQQLMEQFNIDYVESIARTGMVWTTTGYNKEITQMLQPAFMLAVYNSAGHTNQYPGTAWGFNLFWSTTMGGAGGSYEPDNTPEYRNFNMQMMMMMAAATKRLIRSSAADPAVYMSDSWDMKRCCDRSVQEMMPSGDTCNYDKAAFGWSSGYGYNNANNMAPFVLKMCYALFPDPTYLWAARRLDQMAVTVGILPTRLEPTETYPPWVHFWNVTLAQPTSNITNASSVSYFRTSPAAYCSYGGLMLCRGSPQNKTALVANSIALRTGTSDDSAFAMVGMAALGQHANPDQRLCLENSMFRSAYIVARAGRPTQQNQCNGPVVMDASTPYEFPLAQLNSSIPVLSGVNYTISYANATQLPGNIAYGDVLYPTFMINNVAVRRQTLLLPTGVLVVRDTFTAGANLATPQKVGPNWRLWPGITSNGSNWAVQAARNAFNSTASFKSAPASTLGSLFWISPAAGRKMGFTYEALNVYVPTATATQSLWNFWAYDILSAGQSTTFTTLIAPLQQPLSASALTPSISSAGLSLTLPYVVDINAPASTAAAAAVASLSLTFGSLK